MRKNISYNYTLCSFCLSFSRSSVVLWGKGDQLGFQPNKFAKVWLTGTHCTIERQIILHYFWSPANCHENFVKSMTSCLSKRKVTPSFLLPKYNPWRPDRNWNIVQCWSYGGLSKDEKKIPKSTKQGRKNRLLDTVLIAYPRATNTSVTSDVNLRLAELSVNTVESQVLTRFYNMEINFYKWSQ